MRGGTGHHTPVPTPSHVGGVAQPPPSSLLQFPPLQRGSTAGPPATRPGEGHGGKALQEGALHASPLICHCYLNSFSLAERDMG